MDNFGRYEAQKDTASPQNYKLKWHKFLIYFSLWAGAIVNTAQAATLIRGEVYGSESSTIYGLYGGLKIVDFIWGIVMIGLAAYMIYVRFQLAGFRIGAPGKLTALYTASLAGSLVYLLAVSVVTHVSLGSVLGDIAVSLIGSVAMLFINQNYYNKRLELFVN